MVATRMMMGGVCMPMTLANIALVWSLGQVVTFQTQGGVDRYVSGLIASISLESGYGAGQAPKHFLVDLDLTPVFTHETTMKAQVYVRTQA